MKEVIAYENSYFIGMALTHIEMSFKLFSMRWILSPKFWKKPRNKVEILAFRDREGPYRWCSLTRLIVHQLPLLGKALCKAL